MTDHQDPPLSHRIIKTTTAITVGGSSMVLSSLALAATVMGLVVATPLMLIFSPVLVPAVVATVLITGGFLATGGFCGAASYLLYRMYKYVTGKHPENLDHRGQKIGSGVAEFKGQAGQQIGQQIAKSGQEEQQHHHGQVGEAQDIEIKDEQEGIAAEPAEQQQPEEEKKQSKSGKKKQQNKGGQESS